MNKKIKVALVFGTRPEAIKMAPLVMELNSRDEFEVLTIVTAQHRQMLDQVLEHFKIKPDYDLNLMRENQTLWDITSDVLLKTKEIFEREKPDVILVHGDTTTTLAASLSAFYARIKIGHVEAGLRTFDKNYPYPEEINRVLADSVSDFHFVPTETSRKNLLESGLKSDETIYKTGNTVIDALLYTVNNTKEDLDYIGLNPDLKTILVTAHRRENFGAPLEEICEAIKELVQKNSNVEIVYPVHLNPNVQKTVREKLSGIDRIKLIEPMDYVPFTHLMKKAHLILTDSGGVQEEAPSLGKPVLVLREETERPEAIEYGTVKLVGHNKDKIITTVEKLLSDKDFYNSMSNAVNPYGDGLASKRIADILLEKL